MAKQVLILLALVCFVAAQTLPTFPAEYYAQYTATAAGQTSTGDIYSGKEETSTFLFQLIHVLIHEFFYF